MGTCLKQGNKMNANGFCVKKGQGLKNNHSNFPLIAPPASSPGTEEDFQKERLVQLPPVS